MGALNSAHVGNAINACGCTEALGFEGVARRIISAYSIEPWNARQLVCSNLQRQANLVRRSPLHSISVADGLQYVGSTIRGSESGGWFAHQLSRDEFVQACANLLVVKGVPHTSQDREELYEVFDCMDFDKNGSLGLGEWAAGLSVFFRGSQQECVKAVFLALDQDHSGTLTKPELQEYLMPFVKAMSPTEADALRPILVKKATDDIYNEMDMDHENDISSQEMLTWTQQGNNIIDRLAEIIDGEVYKVWMELRSSRQEEGICSCGDIFSHDGDSAGPGGTRGLHFSQAPYGYDQGACATRGLNMQGASPYEQGPYGTVALNQGASGTQGPCGYDQGPYATMPRPCGYDQGPYGTQALNQGPCGYDQGVCTTRILNQDPHGARGYNQGACGANNWGRNNVGRYRGQQNGFEEQVSAMYGAPLPTMPPATQYGGNPYGGNTIFGV